MVRGAGQRAGPVSGRVVRQHGAGRAARVGARSAGPPSPCPVSGVPGVVAASVARAKPPPSGLDRRPNLRWSGEWVRTRRRILARDRWECQIMAAGCEGRASHVDHIVPRKYGGTDEDANLRAACRSCNQRRGDGTNVPAVPPSVW